MLKAWGDVAMAVRQGDPQLCCVHSQGLGFFRMSNAVAGRHEVDLSGANELLAAQAVAMQHFTFDHPGKSLQPNVRVRPDLHAWRGRNGRAGMIEKAPSPYLAQRGLRNGAVDRDATDIGNTGGKAL